MKTLNRICALVVLSAMAAGAQAEGEVRLENRVQKVEYFTNDQGETESRLVEPAAVVPGDELRYTISFENVSADVTVDAGSVVITNPIPPQVRYLEGSAFGAGTRISYSADLGETWGEPDDLVVVGDDGSERVATPAEYTHIRWVFEPALEPGQQGSVSFRARLR
ncbi:MAG TPA: hypothetical protein VLA56_16110 [Pseudomonadales bacterium]|nr:hypothetical protein [Pseudomonadales bacterium]